jgi:hypothetical protein
MQISALLLQIEFKRSIFSADEPKKEQAFFRGTTKTRILGVLFLGESLKNTKFSKHNALFIKHSD